MRSNAENILSLTNEAAVMLQGSTVRYANNAAQAILGEDCVGKQAAALLGSDFSQVQTVSFLCSLRLQGQDYLLRSARTEDGQLLFFTRPSLSQSALNDAFLYELNTGLMNIRFAIDGLRSAAEDRGDRRSLASLASLSRCYYRMQRMSTNASLLLRGATDSLPVSLQPLDMSLLCRQLTELLTEIFPGERFEMDLAEDVVMSADVNLLKQLLLNLLSNAMIHARDRKQIRLSLHKLNKHIVLTVSDDGCGIEPAQLHTVFERFRHSYLPSDIAKGPGLGLTAARLAAQAHKGTLLLESRPGWGTQVRASFADAGGGGRLAQSAYPDRDPLGKDSLIQDLRVGLADVLPDECFTELFID